MSSNRVSTVNSRRTLHRHDSSFGQQPKVASASNTKSTKIVRDTKKAKQTKEAPRAPAVEDHHNNSPATKIMKLKNQQNWEKIKSKKNRNLHDFDREAEDQFDIMLKGKLGDIPTVPRSIVRIFLSSTFSDMRAERNALVQIVNPKLKEFCSMYDLDFQMVDMRWGVTDDSQNDHTVEKICLQEVENCQKISLGPNFVVIAGNRYGFRPIPTEMSVEQFDLLLKYTADVKDIKLLNTWYLRDDNAQPPQYVLQPIKSQFKFFGDYSPGCDNSREKDKQNWNKTFNEIQAILRHAAKAAFQDGKLTKEELHQYNLSVTEIEVTKGMLQVENPQLHTLAYHRDIFGLLDQALKQNGASRYIDIVDSDGKVMIDEDTNVVV